jgi:hypothetical protein
MGIGGQESSAGEVVSWVSCDGTYAMARGDGPGPRSLP